MAGGSTNSPLCPCQKIPFANLHKQKLDAHEGGHATTRFLEGILEGSLKEVLGRRLVRVSVGTGVPRRVLRRGGVIEGA